MITDALLKFVKFGFTENRNNVITDSFDDEK